MGFIKDFITNYYPEMPRESRLRFRQLISYKVFKKNEIIINAGVKPTHFYILKSGVARSFFIDKNHNEYIATLFVPDRIIGSLSAMIKSEKSKLTYDCLTECEVFIVSYKDFMDATKDDIYLALMYVKFLEYAFIKMELKTHQLSNLDATERYFALKEDITDIENLIPQYHIASYLNITPVQLSRIRKEILYK